MLYFSLFFAELLLLFFLSRNLTKAVAFFLFRLAKNKTITIMSMSLLFFPGTLLHELAHALFAGLLGVPVGKMEFVPQLEGDKVKLGSVQVGQSDPIRRFFIGAAPFFLGTIVLLLILFYTVQHQFFNNIYIIILTGYLVFEIGNTMFSSKKDMEGALELFITLIVLVIIFYFVGIRIPLFNPNIFLSQPLIEKVFKQGSLLLLIPIAIDSIIIFLFKPLHK